MIKSNDHTMNATLDENEVTLEMPNAEAVEVELEAVEVELEEEEELKEVPWKEKDLFKAYLEQVGRYKLLKSSDELGLLRQIQKGRKQVRSALRKLPPEVRERVPVHRKGAFDKSTLAREREEFLVQQIKMYGVPGFTPQKLESILSEIGTGEVMIQEAKEWLVQANLRLVISLANGFKNLGLPFLDLIQEGNLGLMRAIDRFDPDKGFKLSTYATYWIRQGISRAISDKSRVVRLPVHVTERRQSLTRLAHTLAREGGRKPTSEEIAAHAAMSPDKVRALFETVHEIVSLQTPVGEEGIELGEFFADSKEMSPVEHLEKKEKEANVNDILHVLTPREERVIRLRFGIGEVRDYTLEEIGQELAVTRERVRQIERDAIRKLRSSKIKPRLKALEE
jgi:RNA polymerase primary sigma factor